MNATEVPPVEAGVQAQTTEEEKKAHEEPVEVSFNSPDTLPGDNHYPSPPPARDTEEAKQGNAQQMESGSEGKDMGPVY